MRRDATALKAAIGASAILHKAKRERDEDDRIVATIDDYRLAHSVIDSSAAEAHHIVIPETAFAVVEAMEKLGVNKHIATKVTVRALQGKLGVSSTSITTARLYEAIDAGLIEIAEDPSGKPYFKRSPKYYKLAKSAEETKELINTGRELCVFPTADEVECVWGGTSTPSKNSRTAEQSPKNRKKISPYQSVSSVPSAQNRERTEGFFGEQRDEQPSESPLFGDEVASEASSPTSATENGLPPTANTYSENLASTVKPPRRITEI